MDSAFPEDLRPLRREDRDIERAFVPACSMPLTLGGGKAGLGYAHFEGANAIVGGFVAMGAAAGGLWWLLRVSRYRRLLRLALVLAWLASIVAYGLQSAGGADAAVKKNRLGFASLGLSVLMETPRDT